MLLNTYPYPVAISKNRPFFFLPVPSLTMSVCDSHTKYILETLSTGKWEMKDGQRQVLTHFLTLSFLLSSSLSLLVSFLQAATWPMMNAQIMWTINFEYVSPHLCVHAREKGALVCQFWPACMCDHAYTWCIYTLFVSLSHQYAAEVKAGCNDPAMTGQLAVAYLLVWMVSH